MEKSTDFKSEISLRTDQIAPAVAHLRNVFNSGRTTSMGWRKAQLSAFRRMLSDGRKLLSDAMFKDLHRSDFEVYAMEINPIEHEIQLHLDHLAEWMKPHYVSTNLLNLPGWSRIDSNPLGVVLIMAPWNYPIQLLLMPLVGAISAGNCALIRPGAAVPHTSKALAQLIHTHLDNDCFMVAEGGRDMSSVVLKERFDLICFTGGTHLGKIVAEAAARHLTPTILELGGKSPCIVDRTANLSVAAKRVCWGSFMNSGQTCVRPDYLLVDSAVAEPFIQKLKEAIFEFYGQSESQQKSTPFFGRLVDKKACERVGRLLKESRQFAVCGGEIDENDRFIAPTILDFGADKKAFENAAVMSEEIFGPVFPAYRYSQLEEAISYINQNEKPLALYCFTSDTKVQERVLSATTSGGACINDCVMHLTNPSLPFGGVGRSGMGAYHGRTSFDSFSHKRSVLVKTSILDAPARYPPYTPTKKAQMLFLTKVHPAWKINLLLWIAKLFGVAVALWLFVRFAFPRLRDFAMAKLMELFVAQSKRQSKR